MEEPTFALSSSRLSGLRLELENVLNDIDGGPGKKPVSDLEVVLLHLESKLLPSARICRGRVVRVPPQGFGEYELRTEYRDQVRDAHHRLISTMRYWTSDPVAIAAALRDALGNWPLSVQQTGPVTEPERY